MHNWIVAHTGTAYHTAHPTYRAGFGVYRNMIGHWRKHVGEDASRQVMNEVSEDMKDWK
jgi:hypothetical protein